VIGAVASSTPGRNPTPNPTRGRPDLAATHPPPLVGNLVDEDPRHHHPHGDGWVACVRLDDPPGLSPITTVGRFATVEAAQLATDEVWVAR
jgi:hypothetical protein